MLLGPARQPPVAEGRQDAGPSVEVAAVEAPVVLGVPSGASRGIQTLVRRGQVALVEAMPVVPETRAPRLLGTAALVPGPQPIVQAKGHPASRVRAIDRVGGAAVCAASSTPALGASVLGVTNVELVARLLAPVGLARPAQTTLVGRARDAAEWCGLTDALGRIVPLRDGPVVSLAAASIGGAPASWRRRSCAGRRSSAILAQVVVGAAMRTALDVAEQATRA